MHTVCGGKEEGEEGVITSQTSLTRTSQFKQMEKSKIGKEIESGEQCRRRVDRDEETSTATRRKARCIRRDVKGVMDRMERRMRQATYDFAEQKRLRCRVDLVTKLDKDLGDSYKKSE